MNVKNPQSLAMGVQQIIKPLSMALDLTYFDYCRLYPDGSMMVLANDADWVEHFFKSQYPAGGEIHQPGRHLWANNLPHETLHDAREFFNHDNGMTVMYRHDRYIEFFDFATRQGNGDILHFYFNQFEVIEHFLFYFKDKAESLILQTDQKRFQVGPQLSVPRKPLNVITPLHYHFNTDHGIVRLTRAEVRTLIALSKGFRCKDIAREQNVSCRTVEFNIRQAKSKLGITDKFEVLHVLKENMQSL